MYCSSIDLGYFIYYIHFNVKCNYYNIFTCFRLKSLNLVGTEMSNISLPSDGSLFPSLENLLLSENNISKVRS